MTLLLGCIADDYTGASDLANTLSRNGLRTIQTIGVPDAASLPESDAVVIALKTRSIPAEDAVAQSLAAAAWIALSSARHTLFKICSTFDSTDAGNIGPVTEALREATGEPSVVLVTPAFPGTGRTVFQGHLFVGQVPLDESPLRDHPLNPMRDANLVRVLQRQSPGRIGLIPLSVVEDGEAAIEAALATLGEQNCHAAIIDAAIDRHLVTIGAVAARMRVSTGASGMGLGLARALAKDAEPASIDHAPPPGPYAAILAGSCSQATLRQLAVAEATIPHYRLDASALLAGDTSQRAAVDWATALLGKTPVLISSSAPPETIASLQAAHGATRLAHAVEAAQASIAASLVAAGVGRLIVAGGETSGAVVDRLGLRAFAIGEEIAPGVPALTVVGETLAGLRMALKSGNFGAEDFFARALSALA